MYDPMVHRLLRKKILFIHKIKPFQYDVIVLKHNVFSHITMLFLLHGKNEQNQIDDKKFIKKWKM